MSDVSFSELFEEEFAKIDFRKGAIVNAIVVEVAPDFITLNAGLKSDAMVPADQFRGDEVNVGDLFEVVIESLENGFGDTRLSREKAKRAKIWAQLDGYQQSGEIVMGRIIERVKGGFTVEVETLRAFLPGSLVDVKPIRDPGYLEGKELEFKIIKMDSKRNNIVVSRRAVLEAESGSERQARLDELQEGMEVAGIVKNITDYGAFVDLGGVDGLLHITDMAWRRVKHPSELLNVGDELKVKILKFDREKNRVSLGLKQLGDDPWANIARRFPSNTRLRGVVTNITDYGCFVEIDDGVEGLVHMSEMDWTNKNIHPNKVVKVGEEVEVMVLEVDQERRRISLGVKQCKDNPWQAFSDKCQKGEKIGGNIRSITDFGMFIGLDGEIDGLVHLSDISWSVPGEEALRQFKKGDAVEALILSIDPERERISLGIKQLESNPLADFLEGVDKDAVIAAVVKDVDAKQAIVELKDNITGILRVGEYSEDYLEDLTSVLKMDDKIDVKIVSLDKKTQQIMVSHRVISAGKSAERDKVPAAAVPTKATLGDLLKRQMSGESDDNSDD